MPRDDTQALEQVEPKEADRDDLVTPKGILLGVLVCVTACTGIWLLLTAIF
jgi:hypothetical protein